METLTNPERRSTPGVLIAPAATTTTLARTVSATAFPSGLRVTASTPVACPRSIRTRCTTQCATIREPRCTASARYVVAVEFLAPRRHP
jgi:hypothetical protein